MRSSGGETSGVAVRLKVVLQKVKSLVDERTKSTYNLQGFLKDIVSSLQTLDAVIDDAEHKATHSESIKMWLQLLQDSVDEVDDLIDEVQSSINDNSQMPNQVSSSLSRFVIIPFTQQSKLAQALRDTCVMLRNITEDIANIGFPYTSVESRNVSRYRELTGSIIDRSKTIGREVDEEAVIGLILKSAAEAERVSVVPIVGSMGVGTTTLAQCVYNNLRVRAEFEHCFWLPLAGDSQDVSSYLVELRQSYHRGAYLNDCVDIKMELHKLLDGKRVLLVLDGLEDINVHRSVASELIDVVYKGSVFIMTTFSRRAASSLGTTPAYHLQPLSPHSSYQLFTNKFGGSYFQDHPEFEPIARYLVGLCNGIPLILKKVRFLLYGQGIKEWKRLLDELQDGGGFDCIGDEVFEDQRAMFTVPSYLVLPLQSFLLPKYCGLNVEGLICVWMALGFLYSDDPTQSPEYIGRKYAKELVESPLCPDTEYSPGGVVRHIQFNDALHKYAISERQQWFMPRDKSSRSIMTRYIIWGGDSERAPFVNHPNKVHLYILCYRGNASPALVRDIVSAFKCLRVLGLGGCNLEMLPDSIDQLKHLRFLDAGRNSRMKSLPDSICNLWHLQTLFLHGCLQLGELPANIQRLQNLRYLTLTILLRSLPEAIGQLISLRTLALSSCSMLASLPSSFKNLKNLQTLGIVDCRELDLAASSSVKALKGMDSLHTLLLSCLPKFGGLPTDLSILSIVVLKHFTIHSCTSLKETTWITQFKSLHSLTIEDCHQLSAIMLTDVTSKLDGLLELVIRKCPSLNNTTWIRQFRSLRSIIIDSCPELVNLDAGFSVLENLERLEIRGCPQLTEWFASPAGEDWSHITHVRGIELDGIRV